MPSRSVIVVFVLLSLSSTAASVQQQTQMPRSHDKTFEIAKSGASAFATHTWLYGADSGSNDSSSTLYLISDDNGDTLRLGETARVITDIAFVPEGTLYGITFTTLVRIHPATGSTTVIGSLGVSGANALAADANGRLFGASEQGTFFEIDRGTGRARVIGSYGNGLRSAGDLAFSATGTLYGVADGASADRLIRVDPANGGAVVIGSIGFPSVYGLAFGPDGRLWGSAFGDSNTALLIAIDLTTGAGSAIANIGTARGMNGLAASASVTVNDLWPVPTGTRGTRVRLHARVTNTGTGALPTDARVWFWVSGANYWVGSASIAGLAAGASAWYYHDWTIPLGAASGGYEYWAQAWSGDTNISPWKGPQSFAVDAPSVSIASVWPVSGARRSAPAQLWAKITNTGISALPADAKVWFFVNGPAWAGTNWVGYTSIAGLAPGVSTWYSFNWIVPAGAALGGYQYWAQAWVDGAAISPWSSSQSFTVSATAASFCSICDSQYGSRIPSQSDARLGRFLIRAATEGFD